MPIFSQQMTKIDPTNPILALKAMERHIRYLQDQLEFTLTNLDSSNITEIETDKTEIRNSSGTVNISSDKISLSGKNGETFNAGYDAKQNRFIFEIKGKGGTQCIYLSSDGELIITKNSSLLTAEHGIEVIQWEHILIKEKHIQQIKQIKTAELRKKEVQFLILPVVQVTNLLQIELAMIKMLTMHRKYLMQRLPVQVRALSTN